MCVVEEKSILYIWYLLYLILILSVYSRYRRVDYKYKIREYTNKKMIKISKFKTAFLSDIARRNSCERFTAFYIIGVVYFIDNFSYHVVIEPDRPLLVLIYLESYYLQNIK